MVFQSKLLFLEHGAVTVSPAFATEVAGEVKCMWKHCIGEALDFQDPQLVATLQHIKHLIRYVASTFRVYDSMSSSSGLEFVCLLVMNKLFPETKEISVDIGHELVSVLRVPITEHKEVLICKKCKSTTCHHLAHLSP